jgi:Replication-relaxation
VNPAHPVPAAVPAASPNNRVSHAQNTPSRRTVATTTTPVRRPSPPAGSRAGRRVVAGLAVSLSARDKAVLVSVAGHRYLTSRQIERFHFTDHATPLTGARVARRVLRRLHALHVIAHLERRVGGVHAGSASYVWQVGPAGDRLLRGQNGGARRRQREPGRLFLEHCLAVADTHLRLIEADRGGVIELVEVQTEPDCWRRFTGLGGARLVLQPDLYAVTGDRTDPAYVNRWFLEVDRGSESLPTLLKKCQHYEAYRKSGIEQANGDAFPLVVWILPDENRLTRLQTAISRSNRLEPALFRLTTPEHFVDVVARGSA